VKAALFVLALLLAHPLAAANYVLCWQKAGASEHCEVHDSLPTVFLSIVSRDDATVVRVWKISNLQISVTKFKGSSEVAVSAAGSGFGLFTSSPSVYEAMKFACDHFKDYNCGRKPEAPPEDATLPEGGLFYSN